VRRNIGPRLRAIKLKIVEHLWRLLVGRSRLLFGLTLLSLVIGLAFLFGTQFLALVRTQVPGIIAIFVSLVSGITAVAKSLLP
jgi:hypothetical protein